MTWKNLLPWGIILALLIWISSWLVIEKKDNAEKDKELKIRQEEREQLLKQVAQKSAFEDSLAQMEAAKVVLQEEMLELKGELAAARDALEQAKEWQLLRSQEERENDISNETKRVQEAERAIRNAEINLSWFQTQTEALKKEIERLEQLMK